jgi:hypothetical protein
MSETSDPSQALARRWFQKAENDYPQEYEEEPDEEEVQKRSKPLMPCELGSVPSYGRSSKREFP